MTREFFDVKDDDYTDDLSFVCWRLVYLYILFFSFFVCCRMLLLVLWLMSCFCGWSYQYGGL